MSDRIDLGGNDLTIDSIYVGASTPGASGTLLSGSEITVLDGVTPGTAAASKALVLNSSSGITTGLTALTVTTITPTTIAGTPSFSGAPTFASTSTFTGAPTFSSTSTFTGAPTFNANPILGTGKTLKLGSGTQTLTSNAVTTTTYATQITTESLTTAAGASQAFVITLTGAAATDLAFVTRAGGTNTRQNFAYTAIMTSNTCTVTLYNNEPTNAINGTLIFNLWIVKA